MRVMTAATVCLCGRRVSYDCPPGSAVFFTENVCHAGPVWKRDDPRVAILFAYSHLATHWHRLNVRACSKRLPFFQQ
eukprot:COSAG06_NODE_4252_length_4429_cov_5.719169_6_plen_77_part_00